MAVAVDTGGTFTDFVLLREGRLEIHKVPSTPADPSDGFLRGIAEMNAPSDAAFLHGTTVATNAVLERKGARAALLATAGFRDLLELARQTRLELYALHPTRPEPLIPRERCFEVPGRVGPHGYEEEPLDDAALQDAVEAIAATGAESVAVVFLFSFANPEQERRAGDRLRARGLSVSLSSEILPEYREYERASTTACNAYVAPKIDAYLARLEERLRARGPGGRLRIMQSSGGLLSAEAARMEPVRTILSGPAGGVVGAARISALAGQARVLSFDMGGTSTDVSLIDGEPGISAEGAIAGLPVRIPMLEIHTVGAGGGSIAWLDAGGGLRVGPRSAGADPGPAAYGRGVEATVTDASLTLGRLHPGLFLGGRMPLQEGRGRDAVARIGAALGLTAERAAEGIVRVVNAQMARALRRVSVERGHDPRTCCLTAFGGGGPLHACDLAGELGIPLVLVPRWPGVLSALGMLLSDLRKEYTRTVMLPVEGDMEPLEPVFEELEARACREMEAEGAAGIELRRRLGMRYRGQSYELDVPLAEGAAARRSAALAAAFHAAHRERFGSASETEPCEVVHARLSVRAPAGVYPILPYREPEEREPPPFEERRAVWISGRRVECPVYRREMLLPGHRIEGPAVIAQEDATTWLPAGWGLQVDAWYNLLARKR